MMRDYDAFTVNSAKAVTSNSSPSTVNSHTMITGHNFSITQQKDIGVSATKTLQKKPTHLMTKHLMEPVNLDFLSLTL